MPIINCEVSDCLYCQHGKCQAASIEINESCLCISAEETPVPYGSDPDKERDIEED